MRESKPVLQMYGPRHALSSRGLHVRQSSHAWKLVRPMQPDLLELVGRACARLAPDRAARLLCLLDPRTSYVDRAHAERTEQLAQQLLREAVPPALLPPPTRLDPLGADFGDAP